MNVSDLDQSRFPVVYERGQPVAVLVDLETFKRMVDMLEHLKDLSHDQDEEQWIIDLVRTAQAYRQAHPDEVITYDSPEAVLAALDVPDA